MTEKPSPPFPIQKYCMSHMFQSSIQQQQLRESKQTVELIADIFNLSVTTSRSTCNFDAETAVLSIRHLSAEHGELGVATI